MGLTSSIYFKASAGPPLQRERTRKRLMAETRLAVGLKLNRPVTGSWRQLALLLNPNLRGMNQAMRLLDQARVEAGYAAELAQWSSKQKKGRR